MKLNFKQTIFLRKKPDGSLENLLQITSDTSCILSVFICGECVFSSSVEYEKSIECWIDEPVRNDTVNCVLENGGEKYEECFLLRVPKHWEVHLVHQSHHDPGYTDLMSHVFQRQYEWIDRALDDMDKRDDYPEDTRMRIAIEQFWSLDYYIKNAPEERKKKLYDRIKRGDIELTALYANFITEQLGHEECYRALYPSQALAEKLGVHITSALHNDIPGMSWGLCRALCDAGIAFFSPDFPNYYAWGEPGLISYWDHKAIFGHDGPDLCRWVSPDGKKLLMWCDNYYFGGGVPDGRFTYLEDKLTKLEEKGWTYDIVRATVGGATVDNACYIPDYADNATEWNRNYAYPHIVTSTNDRFYKAVKDRIERNGWQIKEIKGDMPGQDYPVAAMSMAQITSTARRTHWDIVAAEKLHSTVADDSVVYDQTHLINETYRDLLIADDHAYGYHFPAGPAMRASYWEKGSYTMRAEANAHDLMEKAMTSIADRIDAKGTALRLTVFNLCGKAGSRPVETFMRELDNCGTIIREGNHNPERRTGYILNNRRHVNPDESFWRDSRFRLVDMESGKDVPYELDDLEWDEPVLYAPERCGLGAGTRRYGFFENPGGIKRLLRFVAEDLPSFGYRCYALVPIETGPATTVSVKCNVIENGIYRIHTDEKGIYSIIDLRTSKEMLDRSCPHRLGEILMRNGRDSEAVSMKVTRVEALQREIRSTIDIFAEIDGAHEVRVRLAVWRNIDRIELSLHMLRSAKPLQTMFIAFPFTGSGFEYQSMLFETEPAKHLLPGAHSDMLAIGDYAAVKGSGLLFSSPDTAVVAMSRLWDGYVSTAHSCIMKYDKHSQLKPEQFDTGWIYAMLTANNFGTNFMCSQTFDGIYRFSFGFCEGDRALRGERESTAVRTQFTDRSRGKLPPTASLFDCGRLHCLTVKKAENGRGFIARLWNHSSEDVPLILRFKEKVITRFTLCDAVERDLKETEDINIAPDQVVTVRFYT